jgi:hypothetical protein
LPTYGPAEETQEPVLPPTTRHCSHILSGIPLDQYSPRPWNETMEAHRAAVRDAILDTTAALVVEQHGLPSVTLK